MKLALIGQPVAHSRSPQIHQHFAQASGREIQFDLIECHTDEVADTVAAFFAEGGAGMNVTLPHKGTVMASCASVSDEATLAEAVNTLVPGENGLRGENTDGRGMVRDLQRLGISLAGKRIGVIGAGGAARGVLKPLLDEQPAELVWSNRNPLKLEGRDAPYQAHGPLVCRANLSLKGDRFDVLINATAAGHSGQVPRLPSDLFATDGIAYDLSYGAAAQPFLDWALAQGAAAAYPGMGMLIEQAALAWQHWTGELPDTRTLHKQMSAA